MRVHNIAHEQSTNKRNCVRRQTRVQCDKTEKRVQERLHPRVPAHGWGFPWKPLAMQREITKNNLDRTLPILYSDASHEKLRPLFFASLCPRCVHVAANSTPRVPFFVHFIQILKTTFCKIGRRMNKARSCRGECTARSINLSNIYLDLDRKRQETPRGLQHPKKKRLYALADLSLPFPNSRATSRKTACRSWYVYDSETSL